MSDESPRLIIVAGANGSGKTTFAVPYTEQIGVQFLNADQFAETYADRGEENAMIKGGREFFRRLNGALERLEDVVIETTLSGTYTTKVVARAKKAGYVVEVVYIFLDDAALCVDRVGERVRKGGHDVPREDIIRRYARSIANFKDNFTNISNVWFLYYNGVHGFEPVAESENGLLEIISPILYAKFNDIG
jgi:predicted ABC-type ATPase